MNSQNASEKLSAFLDDDLDPRQEGILLEELRADDVLLGKYHRYQMIRAGLRSDRSVMPDASFARSVREAIDREPVVLAPRRPRHELRERLTTFAIAASIATLAVLVVRSVNHYSPVKAGEMLAHVNLSTPVVRASMEPDLREYLNMHNESAYLSGAQGLMPSVRLVSGNSGR